MILRFRVSLPGIKGFARVYELKSTTTLYEFHKIMRDDMSCPHTSLSPRPGLLRLLRLPEIPSFRTVVGVMSTSAFKR